MPIAIRGLHRAAPNDISVAANATIQLADSVVTSGID
jgi:hypothetical protein